MRFVLYYNTCTSPTEVNLSDTVGADPFIAKPGPSAVIMNALQIPRRRPDLAPVGLARRCAHRPAIQRRIAGEARRKKTEFRATNQQKLAIKIHSAGATEYSNAVGKRLRGIGRATV